MHINLENAPPSSAVIFHKTLWFWLSPLLVLGVAMVLTMLQWSVSEPVKGLVTGVGAACFIVAVALLVINFLVNPYSTLSARQDAQLYTWSCHSVLVRQYLMEVVKHGRYVMKAEYKAMQRQYDAEVQLDKTIATT